MLQFFPIILLRIAPKFPRLFSILFSAFFDIIHCIGTGVIIIIGGVESELKIIITTLSLPSFDYYKICVQFFMYYIIFGSIFDIKGGAPNSGRLSLFS